MRNITKRQKEILDFIEGFRLEKGFSPTVREVAAHFHFSSTASAFKHIEALEKKGFLDKEKKKWRSFAPQEKEKVSGKGILVIGTIAKGEKIELFMSGKLLSFPLEMVREVKNPYGFYVGDESFLKEGFSKGDLLLIDTEYGTLQDTKIYLVTKEGRTFFATYQAEKKAFIVDQGFVSFHELLVYGSLEFLLRDYSLPLK